MDLCALPHRSWHPRINASATLTVGRDAMDAPCKWPNPAHVFVMPESDLFVLGEPIVRNVFSVMNAAPQHEFQVATHHPERACLIAPTVSWTKNIWLGALLVGEHDAERVEAVRETPAKVRFVHIRPRAGQTVRPLDLRGLNFVIVQAVGEPPGTNVLRAACEASGVRLFLGPRVENAPVHTTEAHSQALALRGGGSITGTK